jgi:hypothetical protein
MKREYGDAFFSTDMWAKFKFEERLLRLGMNCYNIRIVWVLYEILKKNLEVLYDDVTKAFEIVQMNLSTF